MQYPRAQTISAMVSSVILICPSNLLLISERPTPIFSELIPLSQGEQNMISAHVVLPWVHLVFSLVKRWGLGTYHGLRRKHVDTYLNEFVFRYNRRFYRHASFETILGLASHHHPTSYWDIIGRDNPRKGVPTVRRQPRRRRTATGMREDGSRPEKFEPRPVLDLTRQP